MKQLQVVSAFKRMSLPTMNVEDSPLLKVRDKLNKDRNYLFSLYPELKGDDMEAVYKKGLLVTPELKGLVPDDLFHNINDPNMPYKKFGGLTPKNLVVLGTLCIMRGKKRFIALDVYELENDQPKYFPEINLHMARALLHGKGFNVMPWFLTADGNTGSKDEENKMLADLIKSECKKYDVPCMKVSINNRTTRDFISI